MLGEFTIIRKAKEAGFERGNVVGRVVPPPTRCPHPNPNHVNFMWPRRIKVADGIKVANQIL